MLRFSSTKGLSAQLLSKVTRKPRFEGSCTDSLLVLEKLSIYQQSIAKVMWQAVHNAVLPVYNS